MFPSNQPSPSPPEPPVALVVEDNDMYRSVVLKALGQYLAGWSFLEAASVKDALRLLSSRPVDVLVVDMTLPDGTALTLLDRCQALINAGMRAVIFSNHSHEDMQAFLDRGDVRACVEKAQGPRHLAATLREIANASPHALPSSISA